MWRRNSLLLGVCSCLFLLTGVSGLFVFQTPEGFQDSQAEGHRGTDAKAHWDEQLEQNGALLLLNQIAQTVQGLQGQVAALTKKVDLIQSAQSSTTPSPPGYPCRDGKDTHPTDSPRVLWEQSRQSQRTWERRRPFHNREDGRNVQNRTQDFVRFIPSWRSHFVSDPSTRTSTSTTAATPKASSESEDWSEEDW